MTFRHILLPVDFSEACREAARYAADFAARRGGHVTLFHAADEPDSDAERRLGEFLPGSAVVERRVAVTGDPAEEIPSAARDLSADMIVMPTHGYGLLRRFLLGSITAKVLHDADCPVLTMRAAPESAAIRHVLCAVDFGPASANVIRAAAEVARDVGAGLTIAHVLPPPTLAGAPYYDVDLWTATSTHRLDALRTETGVEASLAVRAGDLAASLNELAASTGADLTVIGRHPALGVGGRLRDQAYAVIRESAVPVLSI